MPRYEIVDGEGPLRHHEALHGDPGIARASRGDTGTVAEARGGCPWSVGGISLLRGDFHLGQVVEVDGQQLVVTTTFDDSAVAVPEGTT